MINQNLKNIINEYIEDTKRNIRQLEKEMLHIIYQYPLMSDLTPEDVERVESTRAKIIELEEQLKELKQAHYEETFKDGLPFYNEISRYYYTRKQKKS